MTKTILAITLATLAATTGIALMAGERHDARDDHARTQMHEEDDRTLTGWLNDLFSDDHHRGDTPWRNDGRLGIYREECGGCHLAYPPAMLPAVSWQAMMANLEDHFGENAELDLETRAQIENFLGEHAAGNGRGDYSQRMWRSTRGLAAPLRITETDYFVGQHHEIPRNMVLDNTEVKSFSRCEACHTQAAQGSFDEHEVRIPGYGRWDD